VQISELAVIERTSDIVGSELSNVCAFIGRPQGHLINIPHDGIRLNPTAPDHDLWQAGSLQKKVLSTTYAQGVPTDSLDYLFIEKVFARANAFVIWIPPQEI
jgi:hypothetical protein